MSDQVVMPSNGDNFESRAAHGMAREVAVQAAINMLLDTHGSSGKTHVDIVPSTNNSVNTFTQREGAKQKIDHYTHGESTRGDGALNIDVIQSTGKTAPKLEAKEEKHEDGTTLVDTKGLGKVENITRAILTDHMTLMQNFNGRTGDLTNVWGKHCSIQQVCDTAVLDTTGKTVLGIAKTEQLKDSKDSRLLHFNVYKNGPDQSQVKVGDIHLLERHEADGHTSLDMNIVRAHRVEK